MLRFSRALLGLACAAAAALAMGAESQAPARAGIPETVQKVLANAGCHRPQGNQDKTVTRGHFVRNSQEDWAVLCVSGQSSFVYVVWGGTAQCPSTLATRRGTDRLLRTRGPDPARHIDHDGIEDATTGSETTLHYCLNRSWVSFRP